MKQFTYERATSASEAAASAARDHFTAPRALTDFSAGVFQFLRVLVLGWAIVVGRRFGGRNRRQIVRRQIEMNHLNLFVNLFHLALRAILRLTPLPKVLSLFAPKTLGWERRIGFDRKRRPFVNWLDWLDALFFLRFGVVADALEARRA